jgi:hypothetical protein
MKPQKEGGGNNFFDEDVKNLLQKIRANPSDAGVLRTYLIMERINPPMIKAAMLRNQELVI